MVLQRGGKGWNRSLNRRGVNKQGIRSFEILFSEGESEKDGSDYHNDHDGKTAIGKLKQQTTL